MNLAFKRHYPLILVLLLFVLLVGLAFGNERMIAYTSTKNRALSTFINANADSIQNDTFLFDDDVVHTINVHMDEDDYTSMILTYQQTGEKEYFHADITIDGITIENVGIRLKGNASLRSALGGNGGDGPGGGAPGGRNNVANENQQQDRTRPQMDQNNRPQGPGQGANPGPFQQEPNGNTPGQPFMPGNSESNFPVQPDQNFQAGQNLQSGQNFQPGQPNGNAPQELPNMAAGQQPQREAQEPDQQNDGQRAAGMGQSNIPYQIKFDKYVDNQTYQGYSTIAIRVSGTSFDAAMLHEPVTNQAARLAGIPATLTSYTGFSLNDDEEVLYVVSEVIDETYLAKYFDHAAGILYKAEVGSTMSYIDDNPSSYTKSFSQETRENEADFSALIDFIRFVDESDDETFAEELPQRFDIDSFATYLAVNTLLVNSDSMIGMNNNYYLYYDDIKERFTLLMWDANESLGKMGGNQNMSIDLTSDSNGMSGGMRGGRMGGKNNLIARFIANDQFNALYEEKVHELYQLFYVDGSLESDVNRYSSLIHTINEGRQLVDIQAYDQAVQKILDFIIQRSTYLETQSIINP